MPEHVHDVDNGCAAASRYSLVRVSVTVNASGTGSVRVGMKPTARCWADLVTTASIRIEGLRVPRSEEEAAEIAIDALRQAYPGLF